MKLRRRFKRKAARIEMVPLIDIVFLLLVFFIYAMLSMAVHRGMKVELPESANSVSSEEVPLSVSVQIINGTSVISLNQEHISLDDLENKLKIESADMKQEKEVLLFADKSVSYQQLYKVLDRISGAGITAISLQAEQKR
jgi:biopolymer transport protein ExbD